MSFEYPKNTKIFRNPADLSSSIFNILEKNLKAELNEINFEDHLIRNLYHLPSTTDTDTFKIKESIFFNIADKIRTNDISVLGYTKVRPCQLTYELNYDFLTNELPNTQPIQYKITVFIAEVNGFFTDDGYCKEINLCIDIPKQGNSNIGYFAYTLKEKNSFIIYTFRCLPYNLHKYRSVNELNNEFTSLWKSLHGESLIEQFIMDVTLSRIPRLFDNQTTYSGNLNP
uniref:Mediator of RNA polymerase II transcription subunit 6 n=1 Tax=Strongyloides papillosus TaxID=174720 RepID=A0A0N5B2L7_STREA